jgi:DNA-directed RNA polymerase specialized sigma24 family protein
VIETPHEGREGQGVPPGLHFGDEPLRARSTLPSVTDRPPISQEELRKLLVLKTVRLRMLKIAYSRTRSIADAKVLVSDANEKLLSGISRWRPDPARPVGEQIEAFIIHVAFIIRRCLYNKLTSSASLRERPFEDGMEEVLGDGKPNVEQTAIEIEERQERERRATAWVDALSARMAKDKEAVAVIEQHRLGLHDPEEQAAALKWPLAKVVLAKRRINYHAPTVMAEELKAEREAEEKRILAAKASPKDERNKP